MIVALKRTAKRSRLAVQVARTIRSGAEDSRRVVWLLTRARKVRSYLGSSQTRKLQIGTGPNVLKGWLNTDVHPIRPDVLFLDGTRRFPFSTGTFSYVFLEHVIEHMPYLDGLFMLCECYRVLEPGGRVRIATPDLEVLACLCAPGKTELQRRYIEWVCQRYLPEVGVQDACFAVNNAFRSFGHEFIYDRVTLERAMVKAGFTYITCYAVGESDDENLRALESHNKVLGDETMMRFETMVLEGRHP
jgi:predicted SAM-dependent methyltransferase